MLHEHDPDDPPPKVGYSDVHWWLLNRWAEYTMRWMRALGFLILFIVPGFSQEHHAQGHNDYQSWASQKTSNCCNNEDCGDLADNAWRENAGTVEIEILGKWCPVSQEHYVIKGKSPDWTRAHACVNKNPNASFINPCDRLLCFMGVPKT